MRERVASVQMSLCLFQGWLTYSQPTRGLELFGVYKAADVTYLEDAGFLGCCQRLGFDLST